MKKYLTIEIGKKAGRVTARYAGDANWVFGDTAQEAIFNLKHGWKIYGQMPSKNSAAGRFLKDR